jgi:hypothetical protein
MGSSSVTLPATAGTTTTTTTASTVGSPVSTISSGFSISGVQAAIIIAVAFLFTVRIVRGLMEHKTDHLKFDVGLAIAIIVVVMEPMHILSGILSVVNGVFSSIFH